LRILFWFQLYRAARNDILVAFGGGTDMAQKGGIGRS
jgi:hypothetical protein